MRAIDNAVMAAVENTGPKFIIIDAPPRHGKSEYTSKHLPSWYLGRYPEKHVILTSYGANFARSWGRKARDLLEEHGERLFGVGVSTSTHAANDWQTTYGGGMITAGVGGQITGRGANLFIIDDYLKNAQDAMSELIRDTQWEWWNSTAYTRLEPDAIVVVMATRWHKDDLIGRMINAHEIGELPDIKIIHCPAIAGRNDSLNRYVGQALWPKRWPKKALLKKKRSISKYWWDAMYQGKPGKHHDTEWPADYFNRDLLFVSPKDFPTAFEAGAIAIDPSKGKTKRSDYTAMLFGGLSGGKVWIKGDVIRQPPEVTVDKLIAMREQNSPYVDAIGLEENAWQDLLKDLVDYRCKELGVSLFDITLINNTVRKEIRIRRLGQYLKRDELRFEDTPGMRLLVQQLEEFPMGDHDDGPDGLEMLIRMINHMLKEEYAATQPEEELALV